MTYTKSSPTILRKRGRPKVNPIVEKVVNKVKEVIAPIPKLIVKDWDAAQEKETEIRNLSRKLDETIYSLVKEFNKLNELIRDAHDVVPKTDKTMLLVSPLSPLKTMHYLKAFLYKNGFPDRNNIWQEAKDIKVFSKEIDDGLKWMFKYKGEK